MSANPGASLSIEWVSRMQALENDNNKLKRQYNEIKSQLKETVAVDRDLEKQRAAAAKEQERRNKAALRDIERLKKEEQDYFKSLARDLAKLDIARTEYADKEKRLAAEEAKQTRLRALQEQQKGWEKIANTIRGSVMSAVGALGISFLSIAGIVGVIKSGLDDAARSAAEAANRIREGDPSKRRLLAGVTTAQFPAAQAGVKSIMAAEGMSEDEATGIVSAAFRAGKQDIIPFLGSLGDIGIDAESSLNAYRVSSRAFGRGGAGTYKSFLNRGLTAQEATGTPLNEILSGVESLAPGAGRGMSLGDLTATTAVLGTRYRGAGEASSRLQAVMNKLPKIRQRLQMPPGMENISDIDLINQLPDLEAGGFLLDEKRKRTTIGDVVGRGSTSIMNTMRTIRESSGEISAVRDRISGAAGDSGNAMLRRRFGEADTNLGLSITDTSSRVKGTIQTQQEISAQAQQLAESFILARDQAAKAEGRGRVTRGVLRGIQESALYFEGPEAYIRNAPGRNQIGVTVTDQDLMQKIDMLIQAMDRNTGATNANSTTVSPVSGSSPNIDR